MTGGDFTCKWLAAVASNGLCNCPMHEWHQYTVSHIWCYSHV